MSYEIGEEVMYTGTLTQGKPTRVAIVSLPEDEFGWYEVSFMGGKATGFAGENQLSPIAVLPPIKLVRY